MASSIINAGTVTLAASTTVTGSGTNWLTAGVRAGDLFVHAGEIAAIASVASDTSLTLTRAWPGAIGSGLAYDIIGIEAQTRTSENNSRLRELLDSIEGGIFVEADAFGTLAQRDSYDDEAAGFVFRQTDDASGYLVTWIMGSGGSADWQGPFAYRGVDGQDGVDGQALDYRGEGAPNDAIGANGDTYLDIVNGDTYIKTGGTWGTASGSIKGDGWTGGSYDSGTGVVTFSSDDGLGFSTSDLRGQDGAIGITWTGDWADATAYDERDAVLNDGSSYIATSSHTSAAATEPGVGASWQTVWDIIAEKGTDGAGDVSGPASATDQAIALFDGSTGKLLQNSLSTINSSGDLTIPDKIIHSGNTNTAIRFPSDDNVTVETAGSERLRVDSSGNVGIGTSSPAYPLHVSTATTGIAWINSDNSNVGGGDGAGFFSSNNGVNSVLFSSAGTAAYTGTTTNHPFGFITNNTARMLIDASGNLLVGTTSAVTGGKISAVVSSQAAAAFRSDASTVVAIANIWGNETSGNQIFVRFATDANLHRGSITYNRAVGLVAYNTTSDYRAKDIAGPIEDASSTVLNLKPYMGTMKGATAERPMFVAHETQEVAPYAVTGEKDAVDQDGNPKYQQMDHSALVPLLTAALQEALQKIEALEARITALEAQP